MAIKNIVFDVGNFLVKWAPEEITARAFPDEPFPIELSQRIFKSQIWNDLNLGKLTEAESVKIYNQQLDLPVEALKKNDGYIERFFDSIRW